MINSPVFIGHQQRFGNFFFPALLIFTITLSISVADAQNNTLYLMPEIPQANQLNPAYMRLCRIYVELPVISSVRLNIRNTGFGFHDVIEPGTGSQSDTYFINLSKLEEKLKVINYFRIKTDVNLLGFGFGVYNWYFTFGISNHSDIMMSYPKSILLLRDKNLQSTATSGNSIYMNRLRTEANIWNSIGVSAAREISDGFKIGLRIKYLQGMANAITRNTEITVNSTIDPASIAARLRSHINASFPVNISYDPAGKVKSLNFDNSFDNIISDYIFNGNRGMAIDAGLVYDPDENTEMAASITDLGFIRWKKNAYNFNTTGDYFFNDSTLTHFQTNPGASDLAEALRDSIFKATSGSPKSYYNLTPVKIFAGISHLIFPQLSAGAMTRLEIFDLHIMPSATFSLTYRPLSFFSGSLSYTLMNNKYNQIGAGIAIGNRVVQFYLTADNIPVRYTKDNSSAFFWPYNARMFSLHTGINLLFGCRQNEDKHHPQKYKSQDDCPAYN